jgi:predicted transcriptional regulator
MRIEISEKWLPVYEALASDVRIKIINMLAQKPMNIKDLAHELALSSAIVSMHVRKLENAAIIKCERIHINGTTQKICSLKMTSLEIDFPSIEPKVRKKHEFALPIGHYSDIEALPTCGLATTQKVIGLFDDPRFFFAAERVNAAILWFTQGYVTYKVPNFLMSNETPVELEISLEICSEAPGAADNLPSDISFFFNDVRLGQWTSPGDFGGGRGRS